MFHTTKDIARELQLTPKTIKSYWRRLKIRPTIAAHAAHRWNDKDKNRLINGIRRLWNARTARNN